VTLTSSRQLLYSVPIAGAVLTIVTLATLGLDLVYHRAQDLARAEQNNENLVHALSEHTARTVQAIDLTLVGVGDALARGRVRGVAGSREVHEFLRQTLVPVPFIWGLLVTDAQGIAMNSAPSFPVTPVDLSDRDYFIRQRDDPSLGLYIGRPVVSRVAGTAGRWFISMSRRLTTSDGRFAGVVVAAVDPRYFQEFYAAFKVGPDGSVAMFLRDGASGTLMARSPHVESMVGKSFPNQFRAFPAGRMGSFRERSIIDGKARLISYHALSDLGLVVFVTASERDVLATWWRQVLTNTLLALAFTGLIAGLTVALTRQVRKLSDSEERTRLLFENSLDAIVVATPDGRVVAANPSAERLFGLTEAELCAQGRAARLDPSDPRGATAIEERARTGRFRGEVSLRRGDGTSFPAELAVSGFVDSRGTERIAILIRDTSERRRLEAQVRLQAAALEAAASGIMITERDGTIVWTNAATTTLTGYAVAELWGRNPRILKSGQNPPERYEELWRTITAGRSWHGVLINRRKDGAHYHEEQMITPVLDERGEITHFVAIKQDISERLLAEEELARHRVLARQQERLAEMGRLLAGVAHELNNPLAVVLGRAALLQQKVSDGDVGRQVEKIAESALRCSRIVKNFLALAREYPPEMRSVALNAIVRETIELLGYQLRVENIEVALDLAADLPDFSADPHQLQQVLVNLVTNASHALKTATKARRLTLATWHDAPGGRVVLEVRDTGPGIPESVREHLFEPFVTTKPVGEGTGLGLSICKGIVESHGGTISAESVAGEGTTFRVELPIRSMPLAEPMGAVQAPVGGEFEVLVIDDEPEVASVLADMLATRGHRVDTANNGSVALVKLQARVYDVIFCDLKMPVMDGEEMYRTLVRERPRLARRVVFLTGDTFTSATPSFLAEAGQPFVAKPLSEDAIWQAVAAVTGAPV
jgi:PAS domain S-box-containing protein